MNTSTDWLGEPGKTFAVKILLKSMLNEDSARDFRRESLLLSRVDHPGIIKMYHVGRSPQPFMVMEYCCGGNLWNAIQCDRLKASTLLVRPFAEPAQRSRLFVVRCFASRRRKHKSPFTL